MEIGILFIPYHLVTLIWKFGYFLLHIIWSQLGYFLLRNIGSYFNVNWATFLRSIGSRCSPKPRSALRWEDLRFHFQVQGRVGRTGFARRK